MQSQPLARVRLILAIFILIVGAGLRIASFTWNTALKGDVNLMALTAREFVQHNRLYYPMIYGTSTLQPLMTLNPIGTPATQHPPLYPFLGAVLGKLFGTDDTFSMLKLIDEIGGLALLGLFAWAALRSEWVWEALTAGVLVAAAPILADYSANGSPYILSALSLMLAVFLLRSFRIDSLRDYALAGLVCGVGLQFHNILIGLPLAFFAYWAIERRRLNWAGVGLFILVIVVTLIPWVVWNLETLGVPMYSSSTNYVLQKLGISSLGQIAQPVILLRYLRLVFGTGKLFVKFGFLEVGPAPLLLALAGGVFLMRRDQRATLAVGLPAAAYMIVALAWPVFKYRFLVPALPILFLLAGVGFARLPDLFPARQRTARVAAWLLLIGSLAWLLPGFLNNPPTHYNAPSDEAKTAAQYPIMLKLVGEVRQRDPGVMLGDSGLLDSGIDTVYWSRLPFVVGSGDPPDALKLLADQYHVRYVWADTTTMKNVEAAFPGAQMILSEGPWVVFELPGN